MTAAQKIPAASAETANRYAAQAMAVINGQLTPEQSRHVFISVTALVQFARAAEHAAHLLMTETMTGRGDSALDFQKGMRKHLGEVRDQLRHVSRVLNGEKVED